MKRSAIILLACLAAWAAPRGAPASEGDAGAPTGAVSPPRTGMMLFVSYRSRFLPPIAPALVRMAGYRALGTELERTGCEVVPYPLMEPLLQAWRVRTGESFGYDFLFETTARLGVERLLVIDLAVYADRVILHGRSLDALTGRILTADQIEEKFVAVALEEGADTAVEWGELLERLARGFVAELSSRHPAAGAPVLAVLPVAPVGVEPLQSDLAFSALLGALVRDGRWSLIDPAIVVRDLQDRGYSPGILGDGARRAMIDRFGAVTILAPTLLSYVTNVAGSAPNLFREDVFLTPSRSVQEPLDLSIALVDAETGTLVHGGAEFIDKDDALGLFGIVRDPSLLRRFDRAAKRLVTAMPALRAGS